MEDRWRLVSGLENAGRRSRIAGLRQLTEKAGPPFLRDSDRQLSRVEHDATYRKQRTECMSTRHGCEERNRRSNPGAKRPEKPMSA